jgi:hypothetical protein
MPTPASRPNWADSDESNKASWTTINVTNVMENGQTGLVNEGNSGYGVANRFEMFSQGEGEALVDNLEFLSNSGANLISNGDFASGTNSWVIGGVLRRSFAESSVGIGGSTALHLVSTGRGDTGPNKIARALSATAATGSPNTGTIRAQVRWLKGDPYVLLRVRGNWMEVSQRLSIPANLGTPGLVNSRRVTNAGPAITEVSHAPVLPAVGQGVVVSARLNDPDGLGAAQLKYRLDPSATYTTVAMTNNNGAVQRGYSWDRPPGRWWLLSWWQPIRLRPRISFPPKRLRANVTCAGGKAWLPAALARIGCG